ncbi:hypothetical protein ACFE04_011045 [Oxalis oulophora]
MVSILGWKVVDWVWLKPKRLENYLWQQGLRGNRYRLLFGDLKDNSRLSTEAKSKPMESFSNDITPRIVPFLHKQLQTYGKNFIMWMGPIPKVTIMNPDHIKEILNKNHDFTKRTSNPLTKTLFDGLSSHNGDKWTKHRKIINPAFHQEKLKLMQPAFYASCNEIISKWEDLLSTNHGSYEIDVWPDLVSLTRDVISRSAFGSNFEEGRRIFLLQAEQAKLIFKLLGTTYIPGMRFLPTKINKRVKEISEEVNELLMGIINKRLNAAKSGVSTKDDLLGILLDSNNREIQENKNAGMSIEEIISECKLFYLVTMILYEVLRLYSPVVNLSRKINKETKLGDLTLPAGVQLSLPILLVHHDRDFWGDDVLEFNPERFANGISKATNNQVSYFPFGWGPRICVGQNFALLEAKMAVAMILQRFFIELSPSYVHDPQTILSLHPQHGAQLIFHKI